MAPGRRREIISELREKESIECIGLNDRGRSSDEHRDLAILSFRFIQGCERTSGPARWLGSLGVGPGDGGVCLPHRLFCLFSIPAT
jgi:hypothetical protein